MAGMGDDDYFLLADIRRGNCTCLEVTKMTIAIIYVMYHVDMDSPTFPPEMTPDQRLTAWLKMARLAPDEALKNLVPSDVDGQIVGFSPETDIDVQLRLH
jgi:hypothetical protein